MSSSTEDRGDAHQVLPQPRARARHGPGRARGRGDRLGALAARQRGRAAARRRPARRRNGRSRHEPPSRRGADRAVVSEKSYGQIAQNRYTFKVHQDAHKTQVRQAVEELFDVKVLNVEHHQGAGQAEAARRRSRASVRAGRRPIVQLSRATRSRSSRGPRSNADPQIQAHLARAAASCRSRPSRRSRRRSRRRACSSR